MMANSHFSKPMRTKKTHLRPIQKKNLIILNNMASYTLTKSKNQEKKNNQAKTKEK